VQVLNLWLRQTALQHQGKGISRTFAAVPADAREGAEPGGILGFYALTSAFVLADDLTPRQAKRYPRQIPVTRLGRLAAHVDVQGQGLGRLLLADAVSRARMAAQAVGSAGLFVDAKDAAAARFYQRYGFAPTADAPLKLFLPLW
jgi:GNAT superfamily N-acetyltransferase